MKEPTVTDTTASSGLERIDQLDIMPALFEPILIPPEVDREFGVALPRLGVQESSNASLISALTMLVDQGDAEAIALAVENDLRIILVFVAEICLC